MKSELIMKNSNTKKKKNYKKQHKKQQRIKSII